MSIFTFILEFYFAAMLSISGLTKLDSPEHFMNTLRQQRILPSRSVTSVTRIFPWIEIAIAFFLITGILAIWNALSLLTLFLIFLGTKIVLLLTGRTEDCGCFSNAKPEKIDGVSIVVSTFLLILSSLHLWLIFYVPFTNWIWRLSVGTILFLLIGYSITRIYFKRKIFISAIANQSSESGGVEIGQDAPAFITTDQHGKSVSLDAFKGKFCILLFVLPGCSACPTGIKALSRILQNETNVSGLILASSDVELNQAYATEQNVHVSIHTSTPELLQMYNVQVFPFAIVLDAERKVIANGVALGYEHLSRLLYIAKKSNKVEAI